MKNFKLEANEMLQRNELKTVFGGLVDLTPSLGGNCNEERPTYCCCDDNSCGCTSAPNCDNFCG
ncbi:hypothetical protein [Cellulophaga geojensis]|nr:hypothetical protein [Cellulophaga geojensis]